MEQGLNKHICEHPLAALAPVIRHLMAEAWEEGASDGQWNAEHAFQIERGTRTAIPNPHEPKEQRNDGSEAVRPR